MGPYGFPMRPAASFIKWYGNNTKLVNWKNDGHALQTVKTADGARVQAHNFNLDRIFKTGISWTTITSGEPSFRIQDNGFLFADAAGVAQGGQGR